MFPKVDSRFGQLLLRVPADSHTLVAGIGQADLSGKETIMTQVMCNADF